MSLKSIQWMKRVHICILRGKLVRASRDNVLYCIRPRVILTWLISNWWSLFSIIMTLQVSLSEQRVARYTSNVKNDKVDFPKAFLPPLGFIKRISWSEMKRNVDPELFCACRGERSRALGNPGARLSLIGFSKKQEKCFWLVHSCLHESGWTCGVSGVWAGFSLEMLK